MPTPITGITTTTAAPAASQTKGKDMGKDDFLKLFVAQLQHQDPMKPMEDSAFMGQMASFSTLEQVSNMASANAKMATNLGLSQSIGLIGRTVTYTDADGAPQTGVVERVANAKDGGPTLTVDGKDGVDPTKITQVA